MKRNIILPVLLTFLSHMLLFSQQQYPERISFNKIISAGAPGSTLSSFTVHHISATDLVGALLGPGAVITNLTWVGYPLAIGSFTDPLLSIGLDSGVVICSGKADIIPGPNSASGAGFNNNFPGDSMLSAIIGRNTFDAAVIAFDVEVLTDTLNVTFVFGSEEYHEFANSSYNDIFAFFVSGPGLPGTVNMANIPGTGTPVSINNINNGTSNTGPCINCSYLVSNTGGQEIEYDAYTVPFSCMLPVIYGQTYHFIIAIADASDHILDSGVFIEKNSVLGYASMPVPSFTASINGLTAEFINTTNYARYYLWDYGDGTMDSTTQLTCLHNYTNPGVYNVTMEAHNYYQVATLSQAFTIGSADVPENISVAPEISFSPSGKGLYRINFGIPVRAEIRIIDLTGQVLQSWSTDGAAETILDINHLPGGLYVIQVTTAGKTKSWKTVHLY